MTLPGAVRILQCSTKSVPVHLRRAMPESPCKPTIQQAVTCMFCCCHKPLRLNGTAPALAILALRSASIFSDCLSIVQGNPT